MALTKMHDWNDAVDGPKPCESTHCASYTAVRLADEQGEWFGWENPDGGKLCRGTRIVNSPAEQAVIDAENVQLQAAVALAVTRQANIDAIKAKRDAGTPLSDTDVDTMADILLGRP